MAQLDVLRVVALLRDHLALHDRPVSFLFGAGTSAAVNVAPLRPDGSRDGYRPLIPAVDGLTALCRDAAASHGANFALAWDALATECTARGSAPHIESILSRVQAKILALGAGDILQGLKADDWATLETSIRATIGKAACPAEATIPEDLPHHLFAQWLRHIARRHPVEIFTTNYDILFERSLDRLRVPHFDGFIGSVSPFFSSEAIENDDLLPGAGWARVWKLHGSVNWSLTGPAGNQSITRAAATTAGEMVLPSDRKYDKSRKQPYRALMDRLARVLARPDALLVGAGFSFGDQHINAVLFDVLDNYPKTHVISLMYSPISDTSPIVQAALTRPNLMVLGANAAVIGTRFLEWAPFGADMDSSDPRLGGIVGGTGTHLSAGTTPRLLAGDFAAFAAFLNSMAPEPMAKT